MLQEAQARHGESSVEAEEEKCSSQICRGPRSHGRDAPYLLGPDQSFGPENREIE